MQNNSLKQIIENISGEDSSYADKSQLIFKNGLHKLVSLRKKDDHEHVIHHGFHAKTDANIASGPFTSKEVKSQYMNSSNVQLEEISQVIDRDRGDFIIQYDQQDQSPYRKRTFQAIGIKRSHSFQKASDSYKFSAQNLDYQHDLKISRKKNQLLKNEIQRLNDRQQEMRNELSQLKNKEQTITSFIYNLQHQNQQLHFKNSKYQENIQRLQQQIMKLKAQRKDESYFNDVISNLKQQIQRGKVLMHENEKQKDRQIEKLRLRYQKQIHTINMEFRQAKFIGQNQINSLLEAIHQQNQEIKVLNSKLNQDLLTKKSTFISQNMSSSKVYSKHIQKRFLDRFLSFSKLIDRKIYHSSSKRRVFTQHSVPKNQKMNRIFSSHNIVKDLDTSQGKVSKRLFS